MNRNPAPARSKEKELLIPPNANIRHQTWPVTTLSEGKGSKHGVLRTACRTSHLKAGAPDSSEMIKPIRSVGSLGRSSTHCENVRTGAYLMGGGAAADVACAGADALMAGAGAGTCCASVLQSS